MSQRFPAVILAGGLATRMGGGDKVMRLLAGRPMLAHIVDRLKVQAGPIVLNANGDPARFEVLGLPVIADTVAGSVGPLAGVLAGMEWVSATGSSDHLISVAGDTPFFPPDLTRRLASAACGDTIAVASCRGRLHPAFALWPLALRDELIRFLSDGASFRVTDFIEQNKHMIVEFPIGSTGGRSIDPFFNVNTPDDLQTAEAICKAWRQ
jgi:molybdopterin-guanine dinucleotide biosynthesis protein A